jgi:hypothetical protein
MKEGSREKPQANDPGLFFIGIDQLLFYNINRFRHHGILQTIQQPLILIFISASAIEATNFFQRYATRLHAQYLDLITGAA